MHRIAAPVPWLLLLAACTRQVGPGPEALHDVRWELLQPAGIVEVSWVQEAAAEVQVQTRAEGGGWVSAPAVAGGPGRNRRRVVGLPFGVDVRLRLAGPSGTFTPIEPFVQVPVPEGLPLGTLRVADDAGWYPEGRFLLTTISESKGGWSTHGPFWTVILDRQGRPVWASRAGPREWSLYPQVSVSQDHLLIDRFQWVVPGADADARVIRTYLDEEIESVGVPGHHHAFVELPDGTLAWGSRAHGGGEALVEKRPGESSETVVWTCDDDWPEARSCTSNGLFYDAERETYLYSFYTVESVVEIDRRSGSTSWWAGSVKGGLQFEPEDAQFYWQHGVSWTREGTLLLSSHDVDRKTNLAREYALDPDAGTLTEIWHHDSGRFAATNGDLWRLPNGNLLYTLGSASEIQEITAEGEVVWHLDFEGDRLLGRSEWIEALYPLMRP